MAYHDDNYSFDQFEMEQNTQPEEEPTCDYNNGDCSLKYSNHVRSKAIQLQNLFTIITIFTNHLTH